MSNFKPNIVIDTNVFFAAIRSPRGASFQLLQLIGRGLFEIHISVPLILEHESIPKRHLDELSITAQDIDDLVDYICSVAYPHEIYFTWRPFLSDPDDEFVLEVAVAAGCNAIISFNKKDFRNIDRFNLKVLTPAEFLYEIGVIK